MPVNPIYLTDYPNMNSSFPFSLKIEKVESVVPHRHDFLEFILVLEGRGTETINGLQHPMEPGTLIFLLPYQFHAIRSDPGACLHLYICNFDLELLFDSREGDRGLAAIVLDDSDRLPPYIQLNEREMAQATGLFDDMRREAAGDERMRSIMIKSKLFEALVWFERWRSGRHADGSETAGEGRKESASAKTGFWQMIRYVHRHYREELTLERLARQFHYNASHLSECFKVRTGQNFVPFVQGLRIRHACGLLASTELPVSRIAYEAGFGSFQTFSRSFLKWKGMSPTDYRKQSHIHSADRS